MISLVYQFILFNTNNSLLSQEVSAIILWQIEIIINTTLCLKISTISFYIMILLSLHSRRAHSNHLSNTNFTLFKLFFFSYSTNWKLNSRDIRKIIIEFTILNILYYFQSLKITTSFQSLDISFDKFNITTIIFIISFFTKNSDFSSRLFKKKKVNLLN